MVRCDCLHAFLRTEVCFKCDMVFRTELYPNPHFDEKFRCLFQRGGNPSQLSIKYQNIERGEKYASASYNGAYN